ncbi:histone-lysine N-methyltransferase 2C isoform X3 [Neofelis nebulosa]|uniref:histone-lysine N-methyltransferase 2C isoform X3 n=1 Tax=Neofelis nebulosa TaxID=61452 RepID=UPI002729D4A9|nr:histone-lysine N-methyltransferase 2C isoform X3 [Neofelis nebulosa]
MSLEDRVGELLLLPSCDTSRDGRVQDAYVVALASLCYKVGVCGATGIAVKCLLEMARAVPPSAGIRRGSGLPRNFTLCRFFVSFKAMHIKPCEGFNLIASHFDYFLVPLQILIWDYCMFSLCFQIPLLVTVDLSVLSRPSPCTRECVHGHKHTHTHTHACTCSSPEMEMSSSVLGQPLCAPEERPRSRGKITVEDEDSMDGLETTETENIVETEIKEQSAEEDAEAEVDISKRPVPVLERSVSEDSASSLVSVGVEVKISEQLCAFCYCGEKSSLGQGDLKQFRVTPGFILPWKSQPFNKKDIDDSSNGTCDKIQNSASRKQRGQRKERSPLQNIVSCVSVSTQTASDDQAGKLWDELSLVGLPDAIDIQALFDPTGTCWAHHRCVEWSLGVRQLEEPSPVSVDKAVVSGSTERCAFCKHLGATIKCCEDKCTQMYHYPCAAGAGTFQDFRNFFLLCPEHIDQAPERSKEDANCAVCDSPGDLLDQFFCTTCGQHYHGMCLDIAVTPLKRAGWQCPECKVCQNCKQSGEDSKMLVCDTCDKGYHTFCLQPVMKSVPTNGWKCKNCRICVECGTRSSSQWHHNCLVCDSCYQQQDNLCPFCGKCYHPELQKDMLHCNMCKRWVHLECDKPTDHELESQFKEEYICMYCKHLAAEMDPLQPGDEVEMAEVTTDCNNEMEVEGPEDRMVFPEQVVNEDISGQESTPGIVPDAVHIHTEEQLKSNSPESLDTHDLLISESSQDKMNPALENQISQEVDSEKMEMSSKVMHICDENQNENKMEVTENVDVLTHQITVRHEDLQLEEPKMLASAEESRPPKLSIESATGPPEALRSPCEEGTSLCSKEHLAVERVPEAMEQKESSESSAAFMDFEMAPVVESCVKDGLCQEDKSVKLPSETELSFSSAAGVSKANASSSPLSSDLPSQDTLHSYPSTLSASVGNIMPTTYISVTPKIGMGKPAITKRKFSPGRPRSKQGAWSTHNTVSPPSWSPDISEGREIFKPRQLPGSAIWSIKVGRGSGFPGKRRPRGAGLSGRGGRGRSKLKSGIGAVVLPGVSAADLSSNKDEEENSMHNTVVLFSSSDKFTLHQDMCVVCGSFGQGAEGRLLACSQCGQCYHPYCVSIKITKVVLSKGWRCLECTVCEACGKATDPGRLLLCDDCDISYHTYCLDPPLQTVPKGGWKCKWCVWCRHCGATSAGLRCEWQNNYTQCAPCASLSSCPVCYRNYREEDLILQCRQCDRWMHAVCQNLNTEEEVENVADIGFDCSMCRPYMPTSNVPSSDGCESSLVAQIVTKVKELDPPKTYTQDGVCLTESGMTQLQSLTVTVPRRKRSKPKLKLKIINQNSVAVLQTPPDIQSEHSRDGEMDDSREGELVDCDGKSESSPERETVDDETKGAEGTDGVKKRKRKPYRPGIGGFMVRQRSRTGQGKTKRSVIRKDSSGSISEQLPNRDDGWSEHLPDTLVDESVSVTENTEKIKKRYRKRKNKLEETFPAYLQEAFFGKDLLDTSRQNKLSLDNLSEDAAQLSYKTNMNTNFLDPSLDPLLSSSSTPAKPGTHGTTDDPLADISEVLNTDDDILGIISDDLAKSVDHSGLDLCTFQVESSPFPFAGIDIGPVADDASSLPQPSVNPTSRPLSEEQLDGILSPELDKMVTDGAILGKLYKIPELGGKDVEDLFTAVLSPATAQPTPLAQPPPPPAPQLLPIHSQGMSPLEKFHVFSRMPLMNGLIGPNPHLPHNSLPPGSGLGTFSTVAQSPYTDTRDKNPAFHPMASDPNSSWTSSAPTVEGENDTMSNAQRSTLKWEKEEALGEMATVAPVLYTNINFPSLKEEFPDWTTRVKQIAKLWRKASSQERAPYVQKARDNRAALRINKVQMSNDPLKRQQQQDSIDPGSRIDSDLFKDPLKQRESEHEQEWKFRQQMRQKSKQQAKIEATQKLEQVKNEQQQQQQQFGAQPPVAPSGSDTPSSGIQSPLTPQPGNGNASPAQAFHKDLFPKQLPSAPSSASSDDVFVKPQAPPPAAAPARGPPVQESLSQPQTCQPPSPQVFSAGSAHSRPPSPVVDPYAKMVGTPRPPPGGHGFSRRNSAALVENCAPLPPVPRPAPVSEATANRPSPVRDFCASSTANGDPYAKPPDTPRPTMTDQFPKPSGLPRSPVVAEQTAKGPLAAGTSDHFSKPSPRADVFQRQRIPDPYARPLLTPAPPDSGPGPFKAPMQPPPPSQDPYGPVSQAPRRLSVDPYERPAFAPRPGDNFSHSQSSGPYSQPPLTPHPATNESLAHSSRAFSQPGTMSRPTSQDPYSQPPGTPRPVIDAYPQPSGTSRSNPDPYSQPPGTPRPTTIDPYSQQPPTPRPPTQADLFVPPAANQRHSDPYAHPPGTPRPYSQPPAAPRPRISEGFPRSSMTRPVLMPNQDPFLQAAQNRGAALSGPLIRPPDTCSPSPRPPGPSLSETFSRVSPSATRDAYDQPPMTPRTQSDSFGTSQVAHDVGQSRPGSEGSFSAPSNSPMSSQSQQFSSVSHLPGPVPTSGVTETQSTVNMSQADTEKLRQRQKLREIILQQQQQKKMAGRQEKGSQDAVAGPLPAPLQHWQPDSISQAFARAPPPYPGSIRSPVVPPLGPRYALFPKDPRGPYPPDVTGMGMRPHGLRFGFPGGSHGTLSSQERFLAPPQQIQGPGAPPQLRRSMSVDMPRPLNNSQMNNPVGLPQHFPPQSLPVQQHNILGQAFIELRHRAPDGRPRLPFTAPPGSVLEAPSHPRHGNFIPRPDFPGPRHAEPLRRPSQGLPTQLPLHPNLEQVPPSQQDQSHPAHSSSMVMRSLSHPLGGEFPEASLSTSTPAETASDNLQITTQSSDGLEEKLDTDDPSVKELDVKDLEGVEVKDLDDEDLENLNLDTEDGKGDELDTLGNLETNDPNLDDLLRSGEFDIIAYTDPELDLGDKKSMFNEELDLNVPIDDKIDNQCGSVEPKMKEQEDKTVVPSDKPSPWKKSTGTSEIKTEVLSPDSKGEGRCESEKSNESKDNVGTPSSQASAHTDVSDGEKAVPQPCDTDLLEKRPPREATGSTPGVRGSTQLPAEDVINSCGITASTPVLSSLLANEKSDNSDVRPLGSPPPTLPASPSGHMSSLPPPLMTPPGHMLDSTMNSNVPVVSRVNHTFPQGVQVNPGFIQGQSPVNHGFGTGKPANQTVPLTSQSGPQQLMIPPTLAQQSRERPLLLEEQPLLLQDLLDQERQEQQQQRQMQAMIRQRAEPFFPNIDFDAITDPIMKAKMVALKGINKVMAQNNMGMPPMVMNRFPFMGQSVTGAQTSEGQSLLPQAMAQDGSITHQISRPNPPNFGPGFVNDSQRKQYEEWLQETQQLLQMQQKYLEEQIGAHRKSKKALSAKQRTAKKAGREFPEEDAEQLKHVTEQQSMVQKQLEQIRKQQKEHAELIEDYRIKQQQQQCAMAPPPVMPGVPPQPPLVPGAPPAAMSQPSFPMVPQQLQHQQHAAISGHTSPARMPSLPAWQPASAPAHLPLNPARIQPPVAQLPIRTCTPAPGTVSGANPQSGPPPRVEFDDNNPFSESFQERERRERLREQQERQRIQLMQEVDRQRALQQGLGVPPHGPMRSQLPFCSSDLPCDFAQPPRPLQQSPQHQQQVGQSIQQGSLNSPPTPTFMQTNERRQIGPPSFVPDSPSVPGGSPGFHSVKQVHGGLSGASFQQSPARPPFAPALPAAPAVASGSLPCGQDPAAAHGQSHPGSTQSLIQLYSDIIPEEKGKKKRTRKKKKDDDVESTKAPSTPHSDITAPPTPSISETTSTPTVNTPGELPQQGEPELVEPVCPSTPNTAAGQLCAELESRLPQSELAQGAPNQPAFAESEAEKHSVETPASTEEVTPETTEPQQCPGQDGPDLEERARNKVEEKAGAGPVSSGQSPPHPAGAPAAKGDSGNELLKHLLKNKKSSSLLSQKPEGSFCSEDACTKDNTVVERQNPVEGLQTLGAQMQGGFGCGSNPLPKTDGGSETKKPRSKRTQRVGEKAAPRSKKRRKDEEEKRALSSATDTFTHLKQQLSLLPLMEPIIGVNFAHFLPYGSGQFNSGNRLLGTFGSATLEGVSDYYSQLIYKQNNLSNPPTPPASLPPTPPPMACQKMANGFATTEELAGRAGVLMSHEVTKSLGPKAFQLPFRPQDDLLARAIAQGPKTVDVPASLPTPPHNNQEELRIQDHAGGRDTPDSFVPSSSPESVVGMDVSRYPDLSSVKEEPPEPVPSPIIPILPSSTGKGLESRRNDIKTEPGTLFFTPPFGSSPNGPRSGLISVAITLHPTAAENISSVVAAFSDLLHVRVPNSYEVSNGPDVPSVGLVSSHRVNPGLECRQHIFLRGPPPGSANPPRSASSYRLKPPSVPFRPASDGLSGYKDSGIAEGAALRPQWCCHCKVVILGGGVRKSFRDLAFVNKDSRESSHRVEKDIVFCSNNCFVLYASSTQAKNSESKESAPPLPQSPARETPSRAFHQYSNNISALDVHCLPQLQEEASPPASPPITFPPAFEAAKVEAKPDELKVTVKLKPRLRTVHGGFEDCRPINKKWRGMKWKKWSIHIVIPKGTFKPPCEDEIDEFLKKLGTSLKPDPVPRDYRKCCFCHEEGDGLTDGPARLLNLDLDVWVHLNCALWSTEVYETQAGALINVELALRRGLQMKCVFCHKMGATSGCHRFRCANIYHFTCAIKAQCMFFKDKTMLCPVHKPKGIHEQELSYFAVFRRVYVQRDEVRQIASIVQRGERDHTFRVGSLIFHTIGQLLPQQMQAFHSPKALFPVGYEASRLYWSTRYANRRCRYLCSIEEKEGRPVFVIRIVEQGHEDLVLSDSSPKGVWDKILEPVACVRKQSEMLQLFPAYLKGEDLFGLTVSAVVRIAESLPGVEACENYTFRYGRNPLMELPLAVNPTGCARSEPKMSAHVKRFVLRPHTLNSTSTSKSFQSTVTGELNAPYSKQFVHSKSSQYRKMKTEWKSNVYLARSRIQGLGLYAARDIEKHTMVIEYIGTIIRNEVANRKEKLYESQNRGVYMFRMDSDHVIDATLTGGPARYINHSCAPNCVAEVVTFERGHKIIISSNRRIQKGEELCYDYKFDFEDDQHKIPCHCGAVNCRKWMN